jgi:hypothetical protein
MQPPLSTCRHTLMDYMLNEWPKGKFVPRQQFSGIRPKSIWGIYFWIPLLLSVPQHPKFPTLAFCRHSWTQGPDGTPEAASEGIMYVAPSTVPVFLHCQETKTHRISWHAIVTSIALKYLGRLYDEKEFTHLVDCTACELWSMESQLKTVNELLQLLRELTEQMCCILCWHGVAEE